MHTIVRKKGVLQLIMNCTVDMQEMQVAINDLSVDEKVNVVGMVVEEDIFVALYWRWKNVSTFSIR